MKTYLVGGGVRDRLLGLPVRDRDWVVVGETPAEMAARGFQRVGKGFPVFLHPETGEEYALARIGWGEQAAFHPATSLEDDLRHRDFTINALAEDGDRLIDPTGGRADLEARLVRHNPGSLRCESCAPPAWPRSLTASPSPPRRWPKWGALPNAAHWII